MINTKPLRRRLIAAASTALAGVLLLAGCASGQGGQGTDAPAASGESASFPVTFENANGTTTTIEVQPQRVLSTSVSITGTLLAMDAPVVASVSDAKGKFFPQWAPIAEERGVTNAWPAGKPDLEAAIAAQPDLIIVSTSGADSAMDQLAQLEGIAPTIVVNYSEITWQELATQLGPPLGAQAGAEKAVSDFDAHVEDTAGKINVPSGSANIVSFNGPDDTNPIGMTSGPHARLLTQLGFTIEEPDPAWHANPQQRSDFVFASYENLTQLKGETTFLVAADDAKVKAFRDDPVLANLPSVRSGQVYALGLDSFRVDPYSAKNMVDLVAEQLAR